MTPGADPTELSLLLDIQATQSRDFPERGIARHVAELARALVAMPGLVRGLLINPVLPFPGHLHPDLSCSALLRWNTATEVRRLLEPPGRVAYHLMSPTELGPPVETVLPAHVLASGLPLVMTLYDLIPLLDPARYLDQPQKRERYLVRMAVFRSAELVLTLSESVRRDAIRLLELDPGRVATVGAGAGRFFSPAPRGADAFALVRRSIPEITGQFVLSVTGTDARKNTERLIEAYAQLGADLRRRFQLVLACHVDAATAATWRAHAARCGLAEKELVLTGRIDDAVLRELYRAATVMVFPSLLEGFGLPVAEAIACGCPVITSGDSAIPEVLDDARTTFDAHDVGAITAALREALESPRRLGMLRDVARRRATWWTWESVAERETAALGLLPREAGAPRTSRQRIALVGMLPPDCAPLIEPVAAALAKGCHLDVYTDGRLAADWLPPGGARLPVRALDRTGAAATYDAVIYAISGAAADEPILAAARRHPGIVWLVGEGAADLYREDARTHEESPPGGARRDEEPGPASPAQLLAEAVRAQYADRAPAPLLDELDAGGELSPALERRFGVLLLGELVLGARVVVVADEAAERRVDLDLGPAGLRRPVVALPGAAGPLAIAARLLEVVAALAEEAAPGAGAPPLAQVS